MMIQVLIAILLVADVLLIIQIVDLTKDISQLEQSIEQINKNKTKHEIIP